jgi:formylglycine-generating enzyme required for sulfatase activity
MNYVDGISQEQIDAANKAGVPVTIEEDLGGGVKIKMVFIPPGEFMMGSPENEQGRFDSESPQHKVNIKQGFYLSETELTQAQWQAVMSENPSYFKNGERGTSKDMSNHPVESISWDKVQECLKKLNAKGKGGYRLPSETEWEFAARAGTATRFGFGDSDDELAEYAWYLVNSGRTTHPVATRKSNGWGLFDMHGNVWEWCEDDWHGNYAGAPSDEKAWNDTPRASGRVLRGGAWRNSPQGCRSALRGGYAPDYRDYDGGSGGVRFARTP